MGERPLPKDRRDAPAQLKPCGKDSTVKAPRAPLTDVVQACLEASGASWSRVSEGEWGLVAQAGGWPLHVGLALRGGLLRAQAEVLAEGVAEPAARPAPQPAPVLVRFASSAAGAI